MRSFDDMRDVGRRSVVALIHSLYSRRALEESREMEQRREREKGSTGSESSDSAPDRRGASRDKR
jgi:hypothetical protein